MHFIFESCSFKDLCFFFENFNLFICCLIENLPIRIFHEIFLKISMKVGTYINRTKNNKNLIKTKKHR
jgi:hypothetical protein